MIGSRLIKSNDVAAGCEDIVDNYDPFGGNGVALYQLNGNADDLSPNSYDGTPYSITYSTGVFGQAATYSGGNGLTSSIYIPNTVYTTSTSIFSASIWIKLNNGLGEPIFIGNGGTVGGTTGWALYGDNNTGVVGITFRDTNQNQIFDSSGISINDGAWHNLVVTNNNGEYRVYLDAQEVISGTTTLFTNNQTPTYQTFLGNRFGRNENNSGINGQIDQVRIFNTALDPLEVEALYTEELCICGGTVDTLDILDDSSCIALYPLDGNANDLSGNYSGTPTDVSYGVGEFDLAGVFNGSSSYVLVPDSPALRLTGDYTISFWFKTNSIGAIQRLINKDNANDYSGGWALVLEPDSSITWVHNDGLNNQNWNTGVSITANTWYYVTAIYSDSNNLRSFYLNGNLQNSIATNTNVAAETDVMLFGAYGQSGPLGQYFNGYLDQVRIFNKALNSTEVTTLYNETACTKAACTGTTNTLDILGDGSCIAAYPLDGSPADLSGNYNGVQTDVTYPQGEFDLAGAFNGTSSFVSLGATNQFQSPQVAISVWIKPASFSNQIIIGNGNGGSFAEGDFFVGVRTDGYIGYEIGISSSIYEAKYCTTTQLQLNAWNNVVLILDSSLGTNISKIYVNNINQSLTNTYAAGGTFSGNLLIGTLQLNLGKRNISGNELWYKGSIDQVRIFNKALSAGEVTTLYNETPCN